MLSEIRVSEGQMTIMVEGPEGFNAGPFNATWVRSAYPRGKECSFLLTDASTRRMTGVTLEVAEGSLVLGELSLGGAPSA
jgi:hypothetical protein